MKPEVSKYLRDIQDAGRTIVEITSGSTLADYEKNKILRLAVERCFEIVGEALRHISERDPETVAQITNHRRIIAFRNILIHGYSVLKHDVVWSAAKDHLPKLLGEVAQLLARTP
jgi:uncharacterized protein with HEPN domain